MRGVARFRRLRRVERLRRLVRETRPTVSQLIAPLFVAPGRGLRTPIKALPGQARYSPDTVVGEARALFKAGVPAVILFGLPRRKDAEGTEGYAEDGAVQQAVRAVKKVLPDLTVITDVCLCEFTEHGHCALFPEDAAQTARARREDTIAVDAERTLAALARIAVSHAQAGADMVAPSDMMDGRILALREGLDAEGFGETPIMSYAAKFASAFYGPFREAAASAPAFGNRRSYQMDPANRREAIREIEADIEEGADLVMVKPALAYLDVIAEARRVTRLPIAAYNVSGEYAMIKAAAANGWLDERAAALEVLTAITRAGADLVLTYHARDFARWL